MSPKSLGQDTCGPSKSRQWGRLRDSGLGATGEARAGLRLCGRHLLSWTSLDPISLSAGFPTFFSPLGIG